MKKLNSLIEISKNERAFIEFKDSIYKDDIVSGYIPVRSTLNVFSFLEKAASYASSDSGAVICWGSYGSGKSRLATVIARLFIEGFDAPPLKPVWKRLEERGYEKKIDDLRQVLSPGNSQWKPWLVVPMYGTEKSTSIAAALIKSLIIAIQKENLKSNEILGETSYVVAAKKIDQFISEGKVYTPSTNAPFTSYHELKRALLDDYDEDAYIEFKKLHKELTSYDFDQVAYHDKSQTSELKNIYTQASETLRKKGYGGIIVLWDEFGFEIEEMLKRETIGTEIVEELQPFLEGPCKENNVIFMGFTHVSLSEYGTRGNLNEDQLNRIKTVEGRFRSPAINISLDVTENEGYHLLAGFYSKTEEGDKFFSKNYSNLEDLSRLMDEFNIWKDLGADKCYNDIVSPCYPLHPSTSIGLLLLSTQIAQRERTTFYFLQNQDAGGFSQFLKTTVLPAYEDIGSAELMRLYDLFEFFEQAIKTEKKGFYEQYNNAISMLPNASPTDINILRMILLIKVIASPDIVANDDFISFSCVDQLSSHQKSHDVVYSLNSLAKANIIWKNAGTGLWDFVSGQGVNVEIDNKIKKEAEQILTSSLLRLFFEYEVLQTELLDFVGEFQLEPAVDGIIREVEIRILDTSKTNINDSLEEASSLDKPWRSGIIYLLLLNSSKMINDFNNKIFALKRPNLFFLIPNVPLNINIAELKKLIAVLILLQKTEQGEHAYNVLEGELTKLKNQIRYEINNCFGNFAFINENVKVISTGTDTKILKPLSSWNSLLEEVQNEINQKYSETIKVRCGGFNEWKKDSRWTPVTNIISRILDFNKHKDYQKEFLGFSDTSEEAAIINGVLIENGIYKFDPIEGEWSFIDINAKTAIDVINLIYKHFTCKTNKDFFPTYLKLIRAPYGIPNGIIPILIALVFKDSKKRILLYEKSNQIAESNLPKAIVKMVRSPKLYRSRYQELSRNERFVYSIVAKNENIPFENIIGDAFTPVCETVRQKLQEWGKGLPEDALQLNTLKDSEVNLLKVLYKPIYPPLTELAELISDLFVSGGEKCKYELADVGKTMKESPACDAIWNAFKTKVNLYQEGVKEEVKKIFNDIVHTDEDIPKQSFVDILNENFSDETNDIISDLISIPENTKTKLKTPVEDFVAAVANKSSSKLANEDYYRASGVLRTLKELEKNQKIKKQAAKIEEENQIKERANNLQVNITFPDLSIMNLDQSCLNFDIQKSLHEYLESLQNENKLKKEEILYSIITELFLLDDNE